MSAERKRIEMAKTYRCSSETRGRILQCAHDALAKEGSLPSIKALCTQLSLTRGTFYLHFSSMKAVEWALEEDALKTLAEKLQMFHGDSLSARLLPHTFPYFDWLKQDLSFYQTRSFCDDSLLAKGVRTHLAETCLFQEPAQRSFFVYGAAGFLQYWLSHADRCGAYAAARQLDACLLNEVQK